MAVFHYVHLRAFAHETEDRERVALALRNASRDEKLALTETGVDGSHGNRILIMEGQLKSAPAAKRFFAALAEDDPEGFAHVRATLRERVDENLNLHIRLGKQEAYAGRVRVADDDDVITLRAKIRSFETRRDGEALESSLQQLEAFLLGIAEPRNSVAQ